MEQPVKLRPHHGLCLCFFQGKGYSAEFVENMKKIKAALERDSLICLTVGADEICRACPNNHADRCETEEKVIRYDRKVLRRCGFSGGQIMAFSVFTNRVRQNILLSGRREEICGDCQWTKICHFERNGL